MHEEHIEKQPSELLKIEYTDKPVSGWGGLVTIIRYMDRLGIRRLLKTALPDGRTSPNQIPVVEMVLVFFVSVLTGGRRFAHVERIRSDEVVKGILSIQRMPSAMTLTRYFGGFIRSQVEHLVEILWQFALALVRPVYGGMVLDLDSTVFERYGKQQGSLKGYNPRKRGRPSHHPLLAFLAEAKVVLHAWLRSGNTGTSRGVVEFLSEALARLPMSIHIRALRADAGFFVNTLLDDLEIRKLPYVIAVRMYRHFQREVARIQQWTRFAEGLEAAQTWYKAPSWKAPRRLVVVREVICERPEARGRKLIEVPGYTYHVLVTTMMLDPVETWRFYNGRADSENRIKELKDDFGANGYCLQSFEGTDAVFRLICFMYNVVSLFKRDVLFDEKPMLSTIRNSVFVVGAILVRKKRKSVLRLGLMQSNRQRFESLVERTYNVEPLVQRIAQLIISIVAQPNVELKNRSIQSRWSPRRHSKPNLW